MSHVKASGGSIWGNASLLQCRRQRSPQVFTTASAKYFLLWNFLEVLDVHSGRRRISILHSATLHGGSTRGCMGPTEKTLKEQRRPPERSENWLDSEACTQQFQVTQGKSCSKGCEPMLGLEVDFRLLRVRYQRLMAPGCFPLQYVGNIYIQ